PQLRALTHVFQGQNEYSRLMLIRRLNQLNSELAAVALGEQAIYDPSRKVREAAIEALTRRPRATFRAGLLSGLRYPWARVADHAAEALVAVRDLEAIPTLQRMLEQPDPCAPFVSPTKDEKPRSMVREVVRISHLRNCIVCHPPAVGDDPRAVTSVPRPLST